MSSWRRVAAGQRWRRREAGPADLPGHALITRCVCLTLDLVRRARNVAEVANEARSKLHERGERLAKLDERAGDMQNEAAGFAELAKQLADQQRNRKWWQ